LLAFAVFGFSIPAIFGLALQSQNATMQGLAEERMSLFTAVCLLIIYALYMIFQNVTHASEFERRPSMLADEAFGIGNSDIESEEDETDSASLPVALSILVVTVIAVAVLSEFLVDSVDEFASVAGLSTTGVTVVLLPIVGNAVEHLAAVMVAYHGKIDLAIGIACGSVSQIALFAAPVMVLASWALPGPRLTLNFDILSTASIVFSVFVVNATLRDTKTNWLEGAVLVMCYFIVCAAFFLMP
jgi:Ca2+:H+ antiporter